MKRTRREFAGIGVSAGLAIACPAFFPKRVWGANERLNIGVIGVGGRGASDLAAVSSENIVALCDVDQVRLEKAAGQFPNAKKYADYRQLLDQQDLDAVVVATPDHHHAPATIRALRRRLHVYCEKPLTHTVAEARLISQTAGDMKVATQMGTQNHEHPGYLRLGEYLQSGVIGDVQEVHVITDRPGRWWSQGLQLPTDRVPVPTNLSWDLWLGPASHREYHPDYVPFKWRGWWDFGCGAIGDMAIHLMDPAFWALELGGPVSISSKGPPPNPHSGPTWMETTFQFGQRGKLAPTKVVWYEGAAKPSPEVAAELPMNGSLFIGTKGRIAIAHDQFPVLLPEQDFAEFKGPEPYLPKSPGHHLQWLNACKHGSPTGSNFQYAGRFTEIVLLGNVAYRCGATLQYDPATMRVSGSGEAQNLLSKEYRKGWEVI